MSDRARLARHFPPFALEVRTPKLTLRFPDDDDIVALAELAALGVHPSGFMPFTVPWTSVPSPYQERNTLAFCWQQRTTLQSNDWHLTLAVVVDGEVVGTQGLVGKHWAAARAFETGSWLGLAHQGRGIGKEMRAAALTLGFDGFGAARAVTNAYVDNAPSLGVTAAMGYRPNGDELVGREGESAVVAHFAMDRSDWEERRRSDIEVVGAAAVVAMFGSEQVPGASTPSLR